jgi:hypothetical protein
VDHRAIDESIDVPHQAVDEARMEEEERLLGFRRVGLMALPEV